LVVPGVCDAIAFEYDRLRAADRGLTSLRHSRRAWIRVRHRRAELVAVLPRLHRSRSGVALGGGGRRCLADHETPWSYTTRHADPRANRAEPLLFLHQHARG